MKSIEVGDKVVVNKNLKSGYVVGKIQSNDKILYHVRLIDFITQKILGIFVYTEKQLTVIKWFKGEIICTQ